MNKERRTITLTLLLPMVSPPGTPDGWQRLRKFLKALLRSYGLKCVHISERKDDRPHET